MPGFFPNQRHRHSFDFALQLNHLGIRIVNAPEASWMIMTHRSAQGVHRSPLFWDKSEQPTELTTDSCGFSDLSRLRRSVLFPSIQAPPSLQRKRRRQASPFRCWFRDPSCSPGESWIVRAGISMKGAFQGLAFWAFLRACTVATIISIPRCR